MSLKSNKDGEKGLRHMPKEAGMCQQGMVKERREPKQGEDGSLNSGDRHRKRTASPDFHSEIPSKIAKRVADVDGSTEGTTVKKMKSSRQTERPESSSSGSTTTKKRLANLDDSFHSPVKKLKLETDSGRAEGGNKKHVRKRMKYLLQAVLDQMEFYFGDSNLSKDRYLRKLIDSSRDGYLDLSIFANFNKLQSLHKDGVGMKVLAAAIRKSKMLQLNEDGTKVRRTTPLREISQEETDSRTIYVEHLPAQTNHTWIRSVFSQCGKVAYVSLPVYKTTKMIKGFAFVEFETHEEAAKACLLLNNPLPARLDKKPGKFPKGNKTLNRLQKLAPPKIDEDSKEENISDDQRSDSQSDTAGTVSKKKKKKKSLKRKKIQSSTVEENNTKPSLTQTDNVEEKKEQTDGKKKKKKKKRKQSLSLDGKSSNERDARSSVDSNTEATNPEDSCITDVSISLNESAVEDKVTKPTQVISETLDQQYNEEYEGEKQVNVTTDTPSAEGAVQKKKNKRRRKREKKEKDMSKLKSDTKYLPQIKSRDTIAGNVEAGRTSAEGGITVAEVKLSRKERKRLRQEDIRRKKLARTGLSSEIITGLTNGEEENQKKPVSSNGTNTSPQEEIPAPPNDMQSSEVNDSESEDRNQCKNSSAELTSILKSKKGQERKKVEFDPVPITTEFIKGREIRKRKKPKKEKLHLRVITKKEWLALKAEYIGQQKSHMAALKESLRELKLQENQGKPPGHQRVDLEDVFGTKRLKPSQDMKMAHVESLKFIPNVIVQWKCSHDMPRDKIRTMFKEMSGDSIAYIDAKEEAKFGYIRFKDEASAEEFAKLSRHSATFMARVLPADQQEEYWKKANEDRMKKLGRKKQEKGSEKIARKVFERNKATFFHKSNHIVFNDENEEDTKDNKDLYKEEKDGDQLAADLDTREDT